MFTDPLHNFWNADRHAFSMTGFWGMVLDTTIAINGVCAPWGGCKVFRLVQGVADEYFRVFDWTEELFQMFYPVLAKAFGMFRDVDFGSEDHMRRVFARLRLLPLWKEIVQKIKLV